MATGGLRRRGGRGSNWRATYYDHTGRRRSFSIDGSVPKYEAEKMRQKRAHAAMYDREGMTCRADRTTLDQYWRDVFYPALEVGEVAPSTAFKRAEVYRLHLKKPLGHRKLSELDQETVDAAFAQMRRHDGKPGPLSPGQLHGIGRVLTRIAHHAAARGYFGPRAASEAQGKKWVKPFATPSAPKAQERHGLMTLDDFARLVDSSGDIPRWDPERAMFAAAVTLALVCGHRRGEQAPIQLGRNFREIIDDDGRVEYEVEVHRTKTRTPRLHPVRGTPAEVVQEWMVQRAAWLDSHGVPAEGRPGGDYLFPVLRRRRHRGTVIAEVGARRVSTGEREPYVISDDWWARLKREAKLPASFRVHDLRGAYAKFIAGFLTPIEVQQLMGHEDFATTQRYLRSTRTRANDKAADIFGAMELPSRHQPGETDQ